MSNCLSHVVRDVLAEGVDYTTLCFHQGALHSTWHQMLQTNGGCCAGSNQTHIWTRNSRQSSPASHETCRNTAYEGSSWRQLMKAFHPRIQMCACNTSSQLSEMPFATPCLVCWHQSESHYQEPATLIISQCNSIFTDLSIFRYFPRKIGQLQTT